MMMGGCAVGVPLPVGFDMTTLMSEVGDQLQKLRKVGLPKERTQEGLRREREAASSSMGGGSGFGDALLQRSLKHKVHRSSTKTADPKPDSVSGASTITCTRTSADGSSALTTPSTALTSSKSAPGDLAGPSDGAVTASQTSGGLGIGPANGPISSTSGGVEQSSKEADIAQSEGGVDGKSVGEVEDGDPADPENEAAADPHRPPTACHNLPDFRQRAARVSLTQPPSPASPCSPTVPERAMSSPIKQEDSTAVRRHRRPLPSSRADQLPGLEFGRSRPLTPGRRQKKHHRAHATEQGQGPPSASLSQGSEQEDPERPPLSPRPNIAASPRSPQSPRPLAKTPRRGPIRVHLTHIDASSNAQDAALEGLVAEAEATLTGQGERAPDPSRVFGRA
jgi:hypothetical protein